MTTNCKTLAERFAEKEAKGLLDVKFFITGVDEASYEQVCDEICGLYDALENGAHEPLVFKDSKRAQPTAA